MHSLPLSPVPFSPSRQLPNSRHRLFPPHSFSFPLPLRSSVTGASPVLRQDEGDVVSGSTDGPIEIQISPYSSTSTIFATSDEATPLQLSTSVLLTGAISVFLFRSVRRRAKRAKEMRMRSTGVKETKDLKEEALESFKALNSTYLDPGKPPSPVQTLLGGLAAGAVAIILYRFTTTVEASLNRQTISDNFSVRQLTITVRTIVNGLCYLATFVFGANSIGLLLYSVQLAFNSIMEPQSINSQSSTKDDDVLNTTSTKDSAENSEITKSNEGQRSD